MAVVSIPDDGQAEFYSLLAIRPEIGSAWKRLESVLHGKSSTVRYGLKENARRALSAKAGCEFCASFGAPERMDLDAQESLALEFADRLVADYRLIDEELLDRMKEHFSDVELVEFVTWMCFKFGANMLGSIMRLAPATQGVLTYAAAAHEQLLAEDARLARSQSQ